MATVAEVDSPSARRPPIVIDDGVIEEARRRQRRRRGAIFAAAVAALVAALLAALFHAGGAAVSPHPPLRTVSPLTTLTGPRLSGATHLALVVSENGGSVHLVDVDRGSARQVSGLGIEAGQGPRVDLAPHGLGVLATVTHWSCQMWGSCAKGQAPFPDRQTQYVITPSGFTRLINTFALERHQYTTPAFGSSATWVLTWPHRGPCSLTLEPGSHAAIAVPCGSPGDAGAGGLWIYNGAVAMLVDPFSGRLLRRQVSWSTGDAVTRLHGGLALESVETATGPGRLALVDLSSGARTALRWPSRFDFGYQAFPAPHGPWVALEFGEPWYPAARGSVNQATDVWMLNTKTAALTHVPGFPALELIKQSGIAWTADDRLLVAARGAGGHTVLGVWTPGQQTLPIRALPGLDGYSQFVALRR